MCRLGYIFLKGGIMCRVGLGWGFLGIRLGFGGSFPFFMIRVGTVYVVFVFNSGKCVRIV